MRVVRLGGGESRTGGAPRPDSMADSEEPLRPGACSRELELREIRERYDGWARTKATRGRRRAAALEELVRGRRRLGQALARGTEARSVELVPDGTEAGAMCKSARQLWGRGGRQNAKIPHLFP